jgi:hypothetical protein
MGAVFRYSDCNQRKTSYESWRRSWMIRRFVLSCLFCKLSHHFLPFSLLLLVSLSLSLLYSLPSFHLNFVSLHPFFNFLFYKNVCFKSPITLPKSARSLILTYRHANKDKPSDTKNSRKEGAFHLGIPSVRLIFHRRRNQRVTRRDKWLQKWRETRMKGVVKR